LTTTILKTRRADPFCDDEVRFFWFVVSGRLLFLGGHAAFARNKFNSTPVVFLYIPRKIQYKEKVLSCVCRQRTSMHNKSLSVMRFLINILIDGEEAACEEVPDKVAKNTDD
jgi:hypothetical protein